MEHPREEAQRPQKPSIGSTTTSNARHGTKGNQSRPQNVQKQGQEGPRRPIAASLEAQPTSRTARSFESPKGAGLSSPVSNALHAPPALIEGNDAPPRRPSYASPPVADDQPHNGVPLDSSLGQQQPSVVGPCDTQSEPERVEAPISAARPMSAATSTETCSRLPNLAADAHSGILSHQHSAQTTTSADALRSSLPSLVTTAPAVNGKVGSNSSRQHVSSGHVHGSAPGLSPIGQPSADGRHQPVSKPILKMKRTGQNFPISSPRSSSPLRTPASLHQKNAPSPNTQTGPVPQGSRISSKTSESPQTRGIGLPKAVNGPDIDKRTGLGTSVRLSDNSSGKSTYSHFLSGLTAEPKGLDAQSKAVPNPAHSKTEGTPTDSLSTGHSTDHVLDESSDDEIKYESTPKPVVSDDVSEDDVEDDTSDDETELDSEGDATLGPTASREADSSIRGQLFHPPDDESDYGDETGDDGDDDDGTVSSSSPSGSSLAADEEPMVALPSASLQRRQDYPGRILETAKSGRPYHTWLDGKSSFHNGGAIFPDEYQKSTRFPGSPWVCPVRTCRQVHKTAFGLGDHFKVTHKRFTFNDNMDGTLSVVGSYSKRGQHGNYLPVVISRRPLDPGEPPMVEPTEPTGKARFPSEAFQAKSDTESEILDHDAFVIGDVDDPAQSAGPSKFAQEGNAHEMWQYIRPFLTNNRDSAPRSTWVQDVIHLPRVRDIKWNEPRMKEHPYMDSHARDITALIIQVTGVEAPTPCTACAQGRGPFNGCVMISPQASRESRNSVLSCANCYYHCNHSKCSHCAAVVPRRNRERRERRLTDKKQIYNVKVLSDKARGAVRLDKAGQGPRASPTLVDNSVEETSQLKVKIYQPTEIHGFEMASNDRAYKTIKGERGESISMCGALIPDGYDLDRAVPGLPWVCPVRSCRAVFKKIVGLGAHFSVKHRGNLFNDNQDGTLSIVGAYNSPLKGSKHCAPLVISQSPLDENEPPMEASKAPGIPRAGDTNAKPQPRPTDRTALNTAKPVQSAQLSRAQPPKFNTHSRAKLVWNHILPFLPLSLDPGVFDPVVTTLFALPVLQSVQWREKWMKRRLDNDRCQIFAMLVHVLGVDRKDSGEKWCSFCKKGEGPFEGCWTLPRAAAWEAHQYAICCANCLFIHKRAHCSAKSSWESRCDRRPGEKTFTGSPPPVTEWAASATAANGSGQSKKRQPSPSDFNEEPPSQRRRYERNTGSDDEEQTGTERRIVTLPLPLSRRTTRASDVQTRKHTSPDPQTEHSKSFTSTSSSALVMAGQTNSEELLEMEDWEIAPGRIREDGAARPNNIAFSKSFLENNQSIPVAADVSFRVDTIKSGHKLEFEANTSDTRYCSVATGKLRVSIASQPEFVIGPHGVFKVKPGVKAWAQNRLYIDSVVHVVSVRK